MGIFKRIKEKSSRKNRRDGRILSAISASTLTIASTDVLQINPKVKAVLFIVGTVTGFFAGKKALKTEKDLNENERD